MLICITFLQQKPPQNYFKKYCYSVQNLRVSSVRKPLAPSSITEEVDAWFTRRDKSDGRKRLDDLLQPCLRHDEPLTVLLGYGSGTLALFLHLNRINIQAVTSWPFRQPTSYFTTSIKPNNYNNTVSVIYRSTLAIYIYHHDTYR